MLFGVRGLEVGFDVSMDDEIAMEDALTATGENVA